MLAFPHHAQSGWKFGRHHGNVALEQRDRIFAFAERFGVNVHEELRFVVSEFGVVADFAEPEVAGWNSGRSVCGRRGRVVGAQGNGGKNQREESAR